MFDKLDALADRYAELSEAIAQPEVIRDFPRYQACLKERSGLEPVILKYQQFHRVEQQIADARELLSDPQMASEANAELSSLDTERENLLDELRLLLVPPDPLDDRNVVMEIRAGVGGDEAALFAGDLMRMYLKYADRVRLQSSILSLSDTDLGGVNEALLEFSGPEAFGRLKFESGVHCVKRVPVTESSGRIHTSTVTVAVFPEAEEIEMTIDPSDLRIDVFHASGHGGQGVNTTDSAVRVTHLPSGLVVTCQDERSQLENKAKALRVLRSRLLDRLREQQEAAHAEDRKSQIGWGERSDRIRTYYFNHDYVVDHRLGLTVNRTANVMNGDLAPFTDGLRLAEKTEKMNLLNRK
ncbi:peptide chain release factor 1 [Aristaeella lactis]|uniref:Bacterial peptide chain release factor 1 (BRF-1) n=1 Tax=Aristaeella lactis TaxID=3046383 RepID=A0AC61PJ22_9FIRM|nr:peptide chain release factor 1 [Aristaeella lactis]QUA53932.1 peptide chain release factor 1 [Aristaeella lactis]SMC41213.1 bacterial peptide chain release factor 1 (bRF-1) [Aristaeella lactis]